MFLLNKFHWSRVLCIGQSEFGNWNEKRIAHLDAGGNFHSPTTIIIIMIIVIIGRDSVIRALWTSFCDSKKRRLFSRAGCWYKGCWRAYSGQRSSRTQQVDAREKGEKSQCWNLLVIREGVVYFTSILVWSRGMMLIAWERALRFDLRLLYLLFPL